MRRQEPAPVALLLLLLPLAKPCRRHGDAAGGASADGTSGLCRSRAFGTISDSFRSFCLALLMLSRAQEAPLQGTELPVDPEVVPAVRW